MSRILWAVTRDHLENKDVFVWNGRESKEEIERALKSSNAMKFRMFDDDHELYYSGKMISKNGSSPFESEDIFGPLDDYGMPNAGCTQLEVLWKGAWEIV